MPKIFISHKEAVKRFLKGEEVWYKLTEEHNAKSTCKASHLGDTLNDLDADLLYFITIEKKPNSLWEFVEVNYPKYDSCNEIALYNDLQKIVDGEVSGEAEKLFKSIKNDIAVYWGYSLDEEELQSEASTEAFNRLNTIKVDIYEKAIQTFLEK